MNRIVFVTTLSCVFLSTALLAHNFPPLQQKSVVAHRVGTWPRVDLRMGTLSLDGHYFSSVDWWSGNLIVHDLVTGEDRRLTNEGSFSGTVSGSFQFAYFSTISQDGTRVAYQWLYAGRDSSSVDLRIVGVDGSAPRVLYHDDQVGDISPKAWSPDGKHILATFSPKRGQPNQIVLVSVADGSVRVLKAPFLPPHIHGFKMSFSPDGRFIVYNVPQKDSHVHDIALLRADDGREVPLVQHPANDILLGWEPDGDRVLFASDRGGSFGLWVIRVIEGKPHGSPELVMPDIGPNFLPMGFTQTGSYYYGAMSATTDLYVATFDTPTGTFRSPPKLVKQFAGYNTAADWSRDGLKLAYVKQRSVMPGDQYRLALTIRSFATGEERELLLKIYEHQGPRQQRPRWSPDGSSFLLEGISYEGYGGYRVDAKTGADTIVWKAPDGDDRGYSAWSPDGKSIFHRRGGRPNTIVVQELQSGREIELYRDAQAFSVSALALSSDGQQLAFVRGDKDATTITILRTSGGEPRELLRAHSPKMISYLDWTPDGRHLIFGKQQGTGEKQRFGFFRIAAQGGEPEELGLEMDGVTLFGLSVHPDGQRIAFTTGRKTAENAFEVWKLDNFLPALKRAK